MQLIGEKIVVSDRAYHYLSNFVNARNYSNILVLCDENTQKHCLPNFSGFEYNLITMPAGEGAKNWETCDALFTQMIHFGADRKSLLIVLGGGVPGDLGGFCASVYMRGIDFVFCPTTLLSMVDASIGGKLAINFINRKNLLGLFQEPNMVFIQPNVLETLPQRELLSGYAEMLKHGLIQDAMYWQQLKIFNEKKLKMMITHSISIKLKVVEEDPHENGIRNILNFGHSTAHAIEALHLEAGIEMLHGEAVVLGMLIESVISNQKCGLKQEQLKEIWEQLLYLYPDAIHWWKLSNQLAGNEQIWELMQGDKKNEAGTVYLSLIKEIGIPCYKVPVQKQDWDLACQLAEALFAQTQCASPLA